VRRDRPHTLLLGPGGAVGRRAAGTAVMAPPRCPHSKTASAPWESTPASTVTRRRLGGKAGGNRPGRDPSNEFESPSLPLTTRPDGACRWRSWPRWWRDHRRSRSPVSAGDALDDGPDAVRGGLDPRAFQHQQEGDPLAQLGLREDHRLGVNLGLGSRVVNVDVEPDAVVVRVGNGANPAGTPRGPVGVKRVGAIW
jgi:hypothetical protein